MVSKHIIIIIGVSGVGKTTIGLKLSELSTIPFADADDYHPASNIAKMQSGQPLDDADRAPWLAKLNKLLQQAEKSNGIILACSALKESYRVQLSHKVTGKILWVVLTGSQELITHRMRLRHHYFKPELLQSQYNSWELPDYGCQIDIEKKPEEIVKLITDKLLMRRKSEIGLVGLGVMGKSLSRNIAGKNYKLSVYNRQVIGSEENIARDFVSEHIELKETLAFDDLDAFVESLQSPKTVFLMVNAGSPVDAVIDLLSPLLSDGDIIIDGGNSHYKDTERRYHTLAKNNILYIGTGVSGGEEGALRGPSIMPGGSNEAYASVAGILQDIAAKDSTGASCCAYIGKGGAGHFVKMVHNGIEYGEMQLIAEVYGLMHYHLGKTKEEIANIFNTWSNTDSNSYLLEITVDILRRKENEDYLLDLILDKSGNKGTGSWTTIAACELGVAIPTLTAALYARYQSAAYDSRQKAALIYPTSKKVLEIDLDELRQAYQLARIINHNQGYELIAAASEKYNWGVNFSDLSRIWTNGCIIRSQLMTEIAGLSDNSHQLILHPNFTNVCTAARPLLNKIIIEISKTQLSAPCFTSALQYLNAYTQKRSLANVIQAQRDYFGAHTYERVDADRGQKFHTNWTS